jgi:hypothetical protein
MRVCRVPREDTGTPCQQEYGHCDVHPLVRPRAGAAAPVAPAAPAAAPGHDLRAFSWWLIDGILGGEIEARTGSVISSLLRIVSALGPEPVSEQEAYKELQLRGRLMTGLPPRTQEEWDRVARFLDDEAIAELRTWPMEGPRHKHLLERDGSYVREPEVVGDLLVAADEADVAAVIDHEH